MDRYKSNPKTSAVRIKTAKAEIGFFDISNEENIKTAYSVLSDPNNDIPDTIRASAMYHTKLAAIESGLASDLELTKAPYILEESDIPAPQQKTAEATEYSLVFNEGIFPLTSPTRIKLAEDHLLAHISEISPKDREDYAKGIKTASLSMGCPISKPIALLTREKVGSAIKDEIAFRQSVYRSPDYLDCLNKIASNIDNIPSADTIKLIETLDKKAGIISQNPLNYYQDSDIEDQDIEMASKIATSAITEEAQALLAGLI